jgi:type IV secretion system protein VirD4
VTSDDVAIPYGYNEDGTFPSYPNDRHLLTFGPTRSGKGATVIVQALLRVPHSVICIDPKGQNAAITARQRRSFGEVFCLNPFGLHIGEPWNLPKHRFNPLAHLDIKSESLVADVSGLAEALILTRGQDPYFDDTARDLIKTLILHLVADEDGTLATQNRMPTLSDMRRLMTQPEREFVTFFERLTRSRYPFIAQPAGRFLRDTRDISSAISSAITQTGFLDDPVLGNPQTGTLTGNDFTIPQLKQKPITVYLILPGRYMEAYARFFRLIITTAIDQLSADPGGHPVLLLLDEFATLQHLAAISKAFGFAAGFNLQCWAFLQDLPQLKGIDKEGAWESFVANAGLLQFFTPTDMTTANYLKERGGEQIVDNVSKQSSPIWSLPRGVTTSDLRLPVLPPVQTMSMPLNQQIVFFANMHSANTVGRKNYWEIPRLRGLYDRDPYHL